MRYEPSLRGGVEVVVLEPLERIPCVIIVDHSADVSRVVPEVAEASGVVIGLRVVVVRFVAKVSRQEGETLANVLGVGVDEGVGSDDSELHVTSVTAKPAAGKAMELRVDCSLLMM